MTSSEQTQDKSASTRSSTATAFKANTAHSSASADANTFLDGIGSAPRIVREDGSVASYAIGMSLAKVKGAMLSTPDGAILGFPLRSDIEHITDDLASFGKTSAIIESAVDEFECLFLLKEPATGDAAAEIADAYLTLTGRDIRETVIAAPRLNGADYNDPKHAIAAKAGFPDRLTADEAVTLLRKLASDVGAAGVVAPASTPAGGGPEMSKLLLSWCATGAADDGVPFKSGDAEFVGGKLSPDVLDLTIKYGRGRNRDDKNWPTIETTFGEFIRTRFTKHTPVKQKDGPAFIQGVALKNKRKAAAISELYMLGLDIDTGIEFDWIVNRVQNELKLTSIIYETFSSGMKDSSFLQSSYQKWAKAAGLPDEPTTETMQRYVREAKSWEADIAVSVQLAGVGHDPEGMVYKITHARIPKGRVLFPLRVPFVIEERVKNGVRHSDVMDLWKSGVMGHGVKTVGLPIDESCLDLPRLFYWPSHPEGGPKGRIVVTAGDVLDFDSIPKMDHRRSGGTADTDPFAMAGAALDGKKGPTVNGYNFKKFASLRGGGFDIARLFRDKQPDRIRTECSSDKLEVECPFDDDHSNAGDTEDRGSWVLSAHGDDGESGFQWGCQHGSCKGQKHDRLDFLAKAVSDGWFTIADLEDNTYQIFEMTEGNESKTGKTPEAIVAEQIAKVGELDLATATEAELSAILKEGIDAGLGRYHVDSISLAMNGAANFKSRRRASYITHEMSNASRIEKAATAQKDRTTKADGGRVKVYSTEAHTAAVKKALDALVARNTPPNPSMFNGADGLVRLNHKLRSDSITTQEVTTKIMQHELRQAIAYIEEQKDGNLREAPVQSAIADDILSHVSTDLPDLHALVRVPYFVRGEDGRIELVEMEGYHEASGYLYKPTKGFKLPNTVPKKPTDADVARAKDLLIENVFVDFPFADEGTKDGPSSRAHALCMLLQMFMRETIEGPTPIYFMTKPMPGTGGGLLMDSIMLIATGHPGRAQTEMRTDEEWRKNITATFNSGETVFWIDNIRRPIDSGAFASLATSEWWTDRILGGSMKGVWPNKLLLVLTGNNVRTSAEMARRLVPIFLDAKGDPTKRKVFKHQNLKGWIKEHRPELVWACLTLIQRWVADGAPEVDSDPLASYEKWTAIFRGLLRSIGVDGLLDNLEQVQTGANEETEAWVAFFTGMAETALGMANAREIGNPDNHGGGECHGDGSLVRIAEECGLPVVGREGKDKLTSLSKLMREKKDYVSRITIAGATGEVFVEVTLRVVTKPGRTNRYYLEPKAPEKSVV